MHPKSIRFSSNQYKRFPLEERFWAYVEKIDGPDSCWTWHAAIDNKGYGRFSGRTGYMLAHRVAWELATGETLTSAEAICHTCDTPDCVRNDSVGVYSINGVDFPRVGHLFKATVLDNVADRDAKGRAARGERSGMHTHPESRRTGDDHWTRAQPERLARGDQNGMRTHPNVLSGEQNGSARLTWKIVRAIRDAYATGIRTQQSLAQEFGIGQNHVSRIIRNESWRE